MNISDDNIKQLKGDEMDCCIEKLAQKIYEADTHRKFECHWNMLAKCSKEKWLKEAEESLRKTKDEEIKVPVLKPIKGKAWDDEEEDSECFYCWGECKGDTHPFMCTEEPEIKDLYDLTFYKNFRPKKTHKTTPIEKRKFVATQIAKWFEEGKIERFSDVKISLRNDEFYITTIDELTFNLEGYQMRLGGEIIPIPDEVEE